MGLALRLALKETETPVRISVGSYPFVQQLRAVLLLLCVAQLWQEESLNSDEVAGLLNWLHEPDELFPGFSTDELTEADLDAALSKNLRLDYEAIPEYRDLFLYFNGFPANHVAFNALSGLWKFVSHSDCDGWLSAGDAKDVHTLLAYVLRRPVLSSLSESWIQALLRLEDFFSQAIAKNAAIAFV